MCTRNRPTGYCGVGGLCAKRVFRNRQFSYRFEGKDENVFQKSSDWLLLVWKGGS